MDFRNGGDKVTISHKGKRQLKVHDKAPGGWERAAELSEKATYGIGLDGKEDVLLTASFPQDKGRKILFSGWENSFLPLTNSWGESLYQPDFELKNVYFQAPGKECINPENNQGCVRLLHGSYPHKCFGFSASGCYFVIVRDGIPTVWKKILF